MHRRLGELRARAHESLPAELVPAGWRRSAVLILVWDDGAAARFALARRSHGLRTQPGKVVLPGGVCEAGEDPVDTALRETEEELGVPRDAVTVMGRLDDHWTVAEFVVATFVGWHDGPPDFHPSPDEVAEVRAVPVGDLLDDARHATYRVPIGETVYEDDILELGPDHVAGMTADILVDLRDWLRGVDRRRVPARAAALHAYAPH